MPARRAETVPIEIDYPRAGRVIFNSWWPLAASWMIMGAEIPAISAVIARLPDAPIHLAAFGGVVYPLALVIEAPILMLLSASTALCKDWASYKRVWRYMMWAGGLLSALHALVVFTPLYDQIVVNLLRIPAEVVEPSRIGFAILLPWTWSIGYRRFNQGVMIRFGHSEAVGIGTVVRLITDTVALGVGYKIGILPGIVVGSTAQALGVVSEAIYAGIRVRPVIERDVRRAEVQPVLSWRDFIFFYAPLVLTAFLNLVWNSIGSAAISRMDEPIPSLAVWPVVSGLIFLLRSPGIAFNEVVVAMLDRPGMVKALKRFAMITGTVTTVIFLLFAATPLTSLWFTTVSALPSDLAKIARMGFWLGLPLPFLSVLQSWFQGGLLHIRQTRGISEALVVFLATVILLLTVGVIQNQITGLYVVMAAYTIANIAQTAWLGWRSWNSSRAAASALESV